MKFTNEFLDIILGIYDHVRFPDQYTKVPVDIKKGLFKKSVMTDVELNSLKGKYLRLLYSLENDVPSFDRLWQFCWFIRSIEKIFFYFNDPSCKWCVECDFNNPKADRKFRYKDDNKEIRFTLSHNVFENDIISIHVIRNYGLKMENKFTIVDSNINYDNDTDLYLINEINRMLMKYLSDTFRHVYELVNKGEFDKLGERIEV